MADSSVDPDQNYPGEILRNGSFEQLDSAGWLADWLNMDRNADGEIVVVTDPHKDGERAVQWRINSVDGWEYWIYQEGISPAMLVPGKRYAMTGWYMTDQPGDIAINYVVTGMPDDEPWLSNIPDARPPLTTVNEWVHFEFPITIPIDAAPGSWSVSLHSIKFTGTPVHLTFDRVSLHPMP